MLKLFSLLSQSLSDLKYLYTLSNFETLLFVSRLRVDVWMSPAELNTRSIPALDGGHEKIFSISEANLFTGIRVEIFSRYFQYFSGQIHHGWTKCCLWKYGHILHFVGSKDCSKTIIFVFKVISNLFLHRGLKIWILASLRILTRFVFIACTNVCNLVCEPTAAR